MSAGIGPTVRPAEVDQLILRPTRPAQSPPFSNHSLDSHLVASNSPLLLSTTTHSEPSAQDMLSSPLHSQSQTFPRVPGPELPESPRVSYFDPTKKIKLDGDGDNVSVASSTSRYAARHGLLGLSVKGSPRIVDKDLPVSPVLTRDLTGTSMLPVSHPLIGKNADLENSSFDEDTAKTHRVSDIKVASSRDPSPPTSDYRTPFDKFSQVKPANHSTSSQATVTAATHHDSTAYDTESTITTEADGVATHHDSHQVFSPDNLSAVLSTSTIPDHTDPVVSVPVYKNTSLDPHTTSRDAYLFGPPTQFSKIHDESHPQDSHVTLSLPGSVQQPRSSRFHAPPTDKPTTSSRKSLSHSATSQRTGKALSLPENSRWASRHQTPSNSSSRRPRSIDPTCCFKEITDNRTITNKFDSSSSFADENYGQIQSGVLDYRRTAKWLREVLKYPETYTPKLTELPQTTVGRRRRSAPLSHPLAHDPIDTHSHVKTTSATPTTTGTAGSRIDGVTFTRAVNDLERLLDEALAIAAQVVDSRPDDEEEVSPGLLKMESESNPQRRSVIAVSPINTNDEDIEAQDFTSSTRGISDIELEDCSRPHNLGFRKHSIAASVAIRDFARKKSSTGGSNTDLRPKTGVRPAIRGDSLVIPTRKSSQKHHDSSRQQVPSHPRVAMGDDATDVEVCSLDGEEVLDCQPVDFGTRYNDQQNTASSSFTKAAGTYRRMSYDQSDYPNLQQDQCYGSENELRNDLAPEPTTGQTSGQHQPHAIKLRGRSHVSLRGSQKFSLAKTYPRKGIARDWAPARKKFVATVACISTALIGILVGIYAGLVPSLQYYIIDESHATVLGNVGLFLGMALPTFICWPLPLLHGRKPYILSSLSLAMPLLFPQAMAITSQRLASIGYWRTTMMLSRVGMGIALGFASMNFHSILTDMFGASLMSSKPHQEAVDELDVRRHGGGMGVWLGIWTWCWIGSLGVGFLIGAAIIDHHPPAIGFYVSIILIAVVLLLNVLCPETRRSAFRRSVTEVRNGSEVSRRVARGEVMMHRVKTGPKWWGEEVYHGLLLSLEMMRQPGFAVMALYCGWIYAQIVLLIILVGSLASRHYNYRSTQVGLVVAVVALGALAAVPFQKASIFSRSRLESQNTNKMTLNKNVDWTSHLVRRAVFTLCLPLMGIGYAASSTGPPLHIALPVLFAAAMGFLSCLAIAECNGIIMETFDCSDLQPGMSGKKHRQFADRAAKRRNYSAFPRVAAAFATCHTLAFVFAAGATALGGMARRNLGQRAATAVVAGILFFLTALLLLVLVRFKEVQIVPRSQSVHMDRWNAVRQESLRRASMVSAQPEEPGQDMPEDFLGMDVPSVAEVEAWRPLCLGNPTSRKRRVNVFELGALSRWTEIRRKNQLVDESDHFNLQALGYAAAALDEQANDLRRDAIGLARMVSQRNGQNDDKTGGKKRSRQHRRGERRGAQVL